MRYCALIGSTSNCTPPFSTQKSPSSIFSSKVNPYWKPEHPPPETNTRSLRLGLASSRIKSPTLPAAASVNTNTSGGGGARSVSNAVSVEMLIVLVYSAARAQSKCRVARGTGVTFRRLGVCPVDQFTIDLGSHRGFNGRVPYISQYARLLAQFHPQGGVDICHDD